MEFRASFISDEPPEARMGGGREEVAGRWWKGKKCPGDWRDCSTVNGCPWKGPGVSSQNPYKEAHNPLTPASRHLMPSSGLHRLITWCHINACRHKHMNNKSFKRRGSGGVQGLHEVEACRLDGEAQ